MRKLFYGDSSDAFTDTECAIYDASQDTSFLSNTLFGYSTAFCIRNLSSVYSSNKKPVELFLSNTDLTITLIEASKPSAEFSKFLKKFGFELLDTSTKNRTKNQSSDTDTYTLLVEKLYNFTRELGAEIKKKLISQLLEQTGSYEYTKNQLTVLCFAKQSSDQGNLNNLWFQGADPSFFDSKNYIYNPTVKDRKTFNLNMFTGAVGYFALSDYKAKKTNIYYKFLEAELLFKSGKLRNEQDFFLWLESKVQGRK
jgi:hypothetical protein